MWGLGLGYLGFGHEALVEARLQLFPVEMAPDEDEGGLASLPCCHNNQQEQGQEEGQEGGRLGTMGCGACERGKVYAAY